MHNKWLSLSGGHDPTLAHFRETPAEYGRWLISTNMFLQKILSTNHDKSFK